MPSVIAYDYLNELQVDEAVVALLQECRQMVKKRFDQLEEIPKEMPQVHLGMVYIHRFYSAKLEWLDELFNRLNEKETT